MKFFGQIQEKWQNFWEIPAMQKTLSAMKAVRDVLVLTTKWAYKLRSVLLAIPVGVMAVALALRNMRQLPTQVGINLLENGEYQWMIARELASMAPLAVTAACIFLMFCSKKVLYPWLISLFSLVLPLVIWITNVFPA
jgi:hypothetical protein